MDENKVAKVAETPQHLTNTFLRFEFMKAFAESILFLVSEETNRLNDEDEASRLSEAAEKFKKLSGVGLHEYFKKTVEIFAPFGLIDSVRTVFARELEGIEEEAKESQEKQDKRGGGGGRKKKQAQQHKTGDGRLQIKKCLVRTGAREGQSLFSSLPVTDGDVADLELADDVTLMDVYPVGFDTVKVDSDLKLKDICPPVNKPTHLQNPDGLYKKPSGALKAVTFLDFGSESSFAPTYDSTDAYLGWNEIWMHYVSLRGIEESQEILTAGTHKAEEATVVPMDEDQPDNASIGTDAEAQTLLSDVIKGGEERAHELLSNLSQSAEDLNDVEAVEDAFEFLKSQGLDLEEDLKKINELPSDESEVDALIQQADLKLKELQKLQQGRLEAFSPSERFLRSTFSLYSGVPTRRGGSDEWPEISDKEMEVYHSLVRTLAKLALISKPSDLVATKKIRDFARRYLRSKNPVFRGTLQSRAAPTGQTVAQQQQQALMHQPQMAMPMQQVQQPGLPAAVVAGLTSMMQQQPGRQSWGSQMPRHR